MNETAARSHYNYRPYGNAGQIMSFYAFVAILSGHSLRRGRSVAKATPNTSLQRSTGIANTANLMRYIYIYIFGAVHHVNSPPHPQRLIRWSSWFNMAPHSERCLLHGMISGKVVWWISHRPTVKWWKKENNSSHRELAATDRHFIDGNLLSQTTAKS